MADSTRKPNSAQVEAAAIQMLQQRGVSLEDIAELVYFLQKKYLSGLTNEACLESVRRVLSKREVQNAVLTGIALDRLAEQGALPWPLQPMVASDEPLYGVDEVMALAIVNVYGTIGLTNYGYVDKCKPGILGTLNEPREGVCNTFLDDIVGAIAAAAASRLAHRSRSREEAAARLSRSATSTGTPEDGLS